MSVKIENVSLVLGASDEATIIKLPSSLVNKTFNFFLTELKNDDEVLVEFDKPKQMVPSFDKLKSDSVLILQHSNAEEGVPATIAVVLELDFNEGIVKMTGYGFKEATLSVETEENSTTEQTEVIAPEDVKTDGTNNVEDSHGVSGKATGK